MADDIGYWKDYFTNIDPNYWKDYWGTVPLVIASEPRETFTVVVRNRDFELKLRNRDFELKLRNRDFEIKEP